VGGEGIIVLTESRDIGTTGGSDFYEDGVYTVVANGSDIWSVNDEFRFVFAAITGDFEISAHVLSLENTNSWAKAGVMVRETLDPDSQHAFMCVTPEHGEGRFAFQCRSMGAGQMTTSLHTVPGQVYCPDNTWVKIRRQGNTFTSFISADGIVWEEFPGPYDFVRDGPDASHPVTIDMPETIYVGLAVTSCSPGVWCTAQFDNVVLPTGGADLLVNGGFEDGVAWPWTVYGGATAEVVGVLQNAAIPEDPIEGGSCLHVVVPTVSTNYRDRSLQHEGHLFEKGKKYTLSAFLKCKQGVLPMSVSLELGQSPWTEYGAQVIAITDEWVEYSITTPVLAEDVSPGQITFYIGYMPGEFWIDGVRFYEGVYVRPD